MMKYRNAAGRLRESVTGLKRSIQNWYLNRTEEVNGVMHDWKHVFDPSKGPYTLAVVAVPEKYYELFHTVALIGHHKLPKTGQAVRATVFKHRVLPITDDIVDENPGLEDFLPFSDNAEYSMFEYEDSDGRIQWREAAEILPYVGRAEPEVLRRKYA